jgi:molybdopterin adenylyltransferase
LPLDESRLFKPVNIALLTVSDTRTTEDDTSGNILAERITAAGHRIVERAILRDDVALLTARLHNWIDDDRIDVVISTGGTGLTGRDVTPEALDRIRRIVSLAQFRFDWNIHRTIASLCSVGARDLYLCATWLQWRR